MGSFVTIRQKGLAGLSPENSDTMIYVREETVALWEALNHIEDNNSLSIDGPPGTGKSTEVWAWALWKARTANVTVAWCHLSKREIKVLTINGNTETITTMTQVEFKDIFNLAFSTLIVDGVISGNTFNISSNCCAWRDAERGRRFILVSSVSLAAPVQDDKQARINNFTVGSWSFKQYKDACTNMEFFAQVKDKLRCPGVEADANMEQYLLAKYFYAGSCARWMFDFDYNSCMRDVGIHMEKVNNYERLHSGGVGDETIDAVNHLRGVTLLSTNGTQEKKYFFTSQYVARELANKCDDKRKFLVSSYKKAIDTKNPAFRGWIFEFDVDYQLGQALKNKTTFPLAIHAGAEAEEWRVRVGKYITMSARQDLFDELNNLDNNVRLWVKPALWCQKAYDFLCFWKDDGLNMVVVNATLAKKHSVLLNVVASLAKSLTDNNFVIKAIRFDFIIPKEEGGDFSIGDISGNLYGQNNLQSDPWPSASSAPTVYSSTNCIVITEVAQTLV